MTSLDEYVRYIEDAPNEATRITRFAMFFFSGAGLDRVETEKRVSITANGKTTTGRMDLACGTLVMEFKTSISGRKLADAEGQLRGYVSGLLNAESRDYTLVATDGIRFNVYGYRVAGGAPLRPDDVTLILKGSMDLKRGAVDGDPCTGGEVIPKIRRLAARAESP